jgi:agmatinase
MGMSTVPTFATRPSFLGIERSDPDAAICIAGIPFDLGTLNRPGARFGPSAIRQASRMLVDGDHPGSWAEIEKLDLADIGDFRIAHGDILGSLAKIEEQARLIRHLVALGGDHTITIALLRALARRTGPLALVHFDGHVDTWPESFGLAWGHGSPFYHAIEEGLIDPHRTIQVGIRSPMHREIFDWTIGKGVTIVTAEDVHETGPQAVAPRIREVVGSGPAYLSFDVDALDPAFAPGTGLDFCGMDVVEVSPPYDVAEITALAAATMVWDYLALRAPHVMR